MRWWGVCSLVVAGLLVVLLSGQRDDAEVDSATGSPAAERAAPLLHGAHEDESPGKGTAGNAREDAARSQYKDGKVVLEGRLLGLPPEYADHVQYRAFQVGRHNATFFTTTVVPATHELRDGQLSYRLVLGNITFPGSDDVEQGLSVQAVAGPYRAPRRFVSLTEGEQDGDNLALTLDLRFVPLAAVRGRVLTQHHGTAIWSSVALFAMRGGEPEPEAVTTVLTDEQGRFEVHAQQPGPYLLVVILVDTSFLWREIHLTPGAPQDLGDLVAEPAAGVTGVLLAGEAALPHTVLEVEPAAEHVRLRARLYRRGAFPLLGAASHGACWLQGGGVAVRRTVRTDDRGRFELDGLRPGPHRLTIDNASLGAAPVLANYGPEGHEGWEVEAPATSLELSVPLSQLRVRVQTDGRPVAGAQVMWSSLWPLQKMEGLEDRDEQEYGVFGVRDTKTDRRGQSAIWVTPTLTYAVRVRAKGLQEAYRHVEKTPLVGKTDTLVFELEPVRPRPSLRVRFPKGSDVACAALGLYPLDANRHKRTPSSVHRSKSYRPGPYLFTDLPSGRWLAEIRPGRRLWSDAGTGWFSHLQELDLPLQGEVAIDVTPRRGGVLFFDVHDVHGRAVAVSCDITDADGRPISTWFRARTPGGWEVSQRLPDAGPCWADETLEPGHYTIRLEDPRYLPQTREVDVVARRTTRVEAVMERR